MKTCLRKEFMQRIEENTEKKKLVADCNKFMIKLNKIVNIKT